MDPPTGRIREWHPNASSNVRSFSTLNYAVGRGGISLIPAGRLGNGSWGMQAQPGFLT
jgi:hypothetical protein